MLRRAAIRSSTPDVRYIENALANLQCSLHGVCVCIYARLCRACVRSYAEEMYMSRAMHYAALFVAYITYGVEFCVRIGVKNDRYEILMRSVGFLGNLLKFIFAFEKIVVTFFL